MSSRVFRICSYVCDADWFQCEVGTGEAEEMLIFHN